MPTPTYYAAVQLDTDTIYGIGLTPEAAVADAVLQAGDPTTDSLTVVPCSVAAAQWVEDHGGQARARPTDGSRLLVTARGVTVSQGDL